MKTASFFSYTGAGRISIARWAPRGTPAGFRVYKPLAPGEWFNKVDLATYRTLYFGQLGKLDAEKAWAELHTLAAGAEPVLLCWEHPEQIKAGSTFCHRHMVAEWFLNTLGHRIEEFA